MRKKMSRLTAVAAGLALFLGVFSGMGITSEAADHTTGTEDSPAGAYISKQLDMAEGITTPNATFTFEFEAVSVDGITSERPPAIADKSISYTSSDTKAPDSGRLVSIKKLSGNVLEGITFPHAGVYRYNVTEKSNTYTLPKPNEQEMIYSQGSFTMDVYVANNAAGTGVYVQYVYVNRVTNDAGEPDSGKVDPGEDLDGNEFTFTNVYKERGSSEEPDPDPDPMPSLEISKTVTGQYGDKTTKEFSFTLNLQRAATADADETYTAQVMNASGSEEGDPITVTPGTPVEFKLKHGYKLIFAELPAGTRYTLTETGEENYTASASIIENGATPVNLNGTIGEDLATGDRLVGGEANSAAYTNNNDGSTITGILTDSLPFILMIAAAAGILALLTVLKRRLSIR